MYTAINLSTFFLVFLMLSLILILCKYDNSYICPLDKSDMSKSLLSTMFAYSPKARFINDNFHHSQPLPENHNFSAITLIWKNLTWKIPTNPTPFYIEKSAVIFRFNLGQLCRECKHICKH